MYQANVRYQQGGIVSMEAGAGVTKAKQAASKGLEEEGPKEARGRMWDE